MDAHDLTFRLIGTQLPPGQLGLADVADICRALQDLNTKISRLVAGQRAGRTGEATARVARLRITSIGVGSTKLGVGYGETNALPDPELSTLEDAISEKFWEIIAGMTTGVRPDWAPEGVARSTLELGDALPHAAKRVEVRRADHRHVRFEAKFFVREPWQASDETVTDETVMAEGELTAGPGLAPIPHPRRRGQRDPVDGCAESGHRYPVDRGPGDRHRSGGPGTAR